MSITSCCETTKIIRKNETMAFNTLNKSQQRIVINERETGNKTQLAS